MSGSGLNTAGTLVDVRLRSPSTVIIAGPTGSGKTQLLMDLIMQANSVADPPPTEIIYCYSEWQSAFDKIGEADLAVPVTFYHGLMDVKREISTDGKNRWFIVDDLMNEATQGGKSDALFTKYSHHLNLTVFLVVQNLFLKSLRTVSVNTQVKVHR